MLFFDNPSPNPGYWPAHDGEAKLPSAAFASDTAIGAAIASVIQTLRPNASNLGIEDVIDPDDEETYWRTELYKRPYYETRFSYEDDYAPAIALGYVMRWTHPDREMGEVDQKMDADWQQIRGYSRLDWSEARVVAADAWDRYDELNILTEADIATAAPSGNLEE